MKAIVAADRCWNIGKNGQLLVHLPKDLAYFKRQTEGKTVVMGRLTYESLPGQKPLPGRTNIVMTGDPESFLTKFADRIESLKTGCAIVVKDEAELLALVGSPGQRHSCRDSDADIASENIFVIGGGQVYQLLLPYCDEVYVTRLDKAFENTDTVFPDLDESPEWEIAQESEEQTENGITYRFVIYKRKG